MFTLSHCQTGVAQGCFLCFKPHLHFWTLSSPQGGQSPGWQISEQWCFLQSKGFPHLELHDQYLSLHRCCFGPCFPQWQFVFTVFGHGGQGPKSKIQKSTSSSTFITSLSANNIPGWHKSKHWCPQSGCKYLLQVSPQEWGTSHGWFDGFSILPQKQ